MSSVFKTLLLDVDERGIAYLKLNRADKHNAMNADMIAELSSVADQLRMDDAVRAVVLSGAGNSFCAGADLGWMRDQSEKDRSGKIEGARALATMLAKLNGLPKPLIARVQGVAFGGGIGLISVCDLAFCMPDVRLGLTETKLGLTPATIAPFVVRRMGEGFARQVFFTGRGFDAEFALRSGLIGQITDDLDGAVEAEITSILACAPGAVANAKALCQKLGGDALANHMDYTIEALADRWEDEEAVAGIKAFFDKTPPPWALN